MPRFQEKRSSLRVSDEELDYYGDLYLGRGIREAGVDFETFLSNPEYYLIKHPRKDRLPDDGNANGRRKGLRHFLGLRAVSRSSD